MKKPQITNIAMKNKKIRTLIRAWPQKCFGLPGCSGCMDCLNMAPYFDQEFARSIKE